MIAKPFMAYGVGYKRLKRGPSCFRAVQIGNSHSLVISGKKQTTAIPWNPVESRGVPWSPVESGHRGHKLPSKTMNLLPYNRANSYITKNKHLHLGRYFIMYLISGAYHMHSGLFARVTVEMTHKKQHGIGLLGLELMSYILKNKIK